MLVTKWRKRLAGLILLSCLAAACRTGGGSSAASDESGNLVLPTLQSPSLGYFLGPVIKDQGFDKKNGLNITFKPEPTETYRTNFASGASQVGASGTLLTDVGLLSQKGVEVQYLFNIYDFWGSVITPKNSEVKKLSDLNGKSFAAAVSTAQYAMFKYVAKQNGLDVSSMKVQSVQTPALVPTVEAKRVTGAEIWEPAYSSLTEKSDAGAYTTFDLARLWSKATGQSKIPYLGLAARSDWISSHKKQVSELYQTYVDAAKYVQNHPAEAARTISEATDISESAVLALLKSSRLRLHVYWASTQTEAVNSVFSAAVKSGYLSKVPQNVVYQPG